MMVELPGTKDYFDLLTRMENLLQWKRALQKGILPYGDKIMWPNEPFRSKFGKVLENLGIPNLTRRYPKLITPLLTQMMEFVKVFEQKMQELENKNQNQAKNKPNKPMEASEEELSEAQQSNENQQQSENSQNTQQATQTDPQGDQRELEVQMESIMNPENGTEEDPEDTELDPEFASEMDELAEGIVHKFEEKMEPILDSLNKAKLLFDDLDDLLDKHKGFGLEHAIWKRSGWRQIDELRRKLEDLKELRQLVRNLGRAGGRGPKRKAPVEISKTGCPPGVIRSPLQPEETSGLCRSGDLSRMLPSESALMAMGWPSASRSPNSKLSRVSRLLHLARRAERNLMSYERAGWLENEPSKILEHMEYRPAAEQGPIIVCLDTSASMQGARETVAKALVLECLRGAHRQNRSCYLYAFSGYNNIKEMELSTEVQSLSKLLDFLEHSFHGGTDVNGALQLSIERLQDKNWCQADILIVTDGEMGEPEKSVMEGLEMAREELGLEVHGLLVGRTESGPMKRICSHLHMFKSWDIARRSR
eukprot:g1767.t1